MNRRRWLVGAVVMVTAALSLAILNSGRGVTAATGTDTRLPNGRQVNPVEDGVYPYDYFPNTEALGPDEMRIVALGTGMPQVIQKRTKASGWYVELGNGDKFLFDLGTGSMENLAALQPDWSQVDTVFLSHLHSDHAGDFAPLYIGGWMNGRYTPLYIYGPTGARPELGTKAFVEGQTKAWAWDIEGRKGSFPDEGGVAKAEEFDYKEVQVIYEKNGVKVTQFPATHVTVTLDVGGRDASLRVEDNGVGFEAGKAGLDWGSAACESVWRSSRGICGCTPGPARGRRSWPESPLAAPAGTLVASRKGVERT